MTGVEDVRTYFQECGTKFYIRKAASVLAAAFNIVIQPPGLINSYGEPLTLLEDAYG